LRLLASLFVGGRNSARTERGKMRDEMAYVNRAAREKPIL
jgi:hypothetical protein